MRLFSMQSFAEQHPGIAFVHSNPGPVRTDLVKRAHWSMRLLNPLLMGLFYPISHSPKESGEFTLYSLLQSTDGVCRRDRTGEDIGRSPLYEDEAARRRVWEHTKEEIERAMNAPA